MKTKSTFKANCIVYGCLNNNRDPSLTFFSLPRDKERRQKWLKLINREDLLSKEVLKKTSYLVCSAHFEESSIKIIKHLKEDAIPKINLPSKLQESPSCSGSQLNHSQTKEAKICTELDKKKCFNIQTQTGSLESKQTQTSEPSSDTTQRKRHILTKLKEHNLKGPKIKCIEVKVEFEDSIHIKQEAPEIGGTEE